MYIYIYISARAGCDVRSFLAEFTSFDFTFFFLLDRLLYKG